MDVAAYARGYLDLIAAKTLGQGVGAAADYLQPTLDIERFLGLMKRQLLAFDSANIGGASDPNYITVPQNEVWILRAAMFQVQMGAGTSIAGHGVAILMAPPEATQAGASIVIGTNSGPVAALGLGYSTLLYPGLMVNPGTRFGMVPGIITGAAANPGSLRILADVLRP